MIDNPQEVSVEEILDRIENHRSSSDYWNVEFADLLTVSADILRNNSSPKIKKIIEDEVEIVSNYNSRDNFPSNDDEMIFSLSMQVWSETVGRKYSKDNSIRGADIINSYVESGNPELSMRYLEVYRTNFVEEMLRRMKIEDSELERIQENISNEKFVEKVVYGCLIICLWHKVTGNILPDHDINPKEGYIIQ